MDRHKVFTDLQAEIVFSQFIIQTGAIKVGTSNFQQSMAAGEFMYKPLLLCGVAPVIDFNGCWDLSHRSLEIYGQPFCLLGGQSIREGIGQNREGSGSQNGGNDKIIWDVRCVVIGNIGKTFALARSIPVVNLFHRKICDAGDFQGNMMFSGRIPEFFSQFFIGGNGNTTLIQFLQDCPAVVRCVQTFAPCADFMESGCVLSVAKQCQNVNYNRLALCHWIGGTDFSTRNECSHSI